MVLLSTGVKSFSNMATSSGGAKQPSAYNGNLQFEQGNNRITMFDGTVYRIIFGLLPDGTIGFIITKEGEDSFDVFN